MLRLVVLVCISLFFTGCKKNGEDEQTVTYSNGTTKPIVMLVPMIDSITHDLPWSLGEELTSTIQQRLIQNDVLYLVDQEKVSSAIKKIDKADNPFGTDFLWIKRNFTQTEFVVFMELIEHEEVPVMTKNVSLQDASAQLNMSVRLRVFDMRGKAPRVVLQELVHDTHHIPRQFTRTNFYQMPWGKESFNISPMGLAHDQFTKEISSRVEDYVLLAAKK